MSLIHHENLNLPYIIQKFSESISRIDPNNFSILKPEKKKDIRRLFERIKDKIIIENSKTDKAVVSILPHYIKELKKNKGFSLILDFIEDSRKNELNVDLSKYIKNARILSMMQRLYEQVNRLYDNPRSKHIRGGAMTDIFNITDRTHYNYYTIIEVDTPFFIYETKKKIHIYFKISIADSIKNINSIYKNKENRVDAIKDNITKFYKFVEDLFKNKLITVTDFENLDLNNLLNDINAMRVVDQLNSDAELPILPETIPDLPGESVVGKLNRIKGMLMKNIKQILQINIEEIELHGSIYFFNINDEKEFLNAYGPLKAVLKYNYNTRQVIDLKTPGVDCSNVIENMSSNGFDAEYFFKGLRKDFLRPTFTFVDDESDLIRSFRSIFSRFAYFENRLDEEKDFAISIRNSSLYGEVFDPTQITESELRLGPGEQLDFVILDNNDLFVTQSDKIHDTLKNNVNFILFDPNKQKFEDKKVWYSNLSSKSLSYIGEILNNDANEISLSAFLNSSLTTLEGNIEGISNKFELEKKKQKLEKTKQIGMIKGKRNIISVAKQKVDEKIEKESKSRALIVFSLFLLTIVILVIIWYVTIASLVIKGIIIAAAVILIFIANICKEALTPIIMWIAVVLSGSYDQLRRSNLVKDINDNENRLETVLQRVNQGNLSEDKIQSIEISTEYDVLEKALHDALTGGSTRFTRKSKNKLKKTKKAIFNKQNKTIKKNKITGGMNNNKYLLNEIIYACISFLELIFFPEDHNMVTLNDYLTMTMGIIGNIKCFKSDVTHHKKGKSIRASR
uniref:Uncharacterized protein n=1 Tax=viral metagenome TaxID=1070528 RepID=A0A6C0JM18_9ZZZZ